MGQWECLTLHITFIDTASEPAEAYKFMQIGSENMEWGKYWVDDIHPLDYSI